MRMSVLHNVASVDMVLLSPVVGSSRKSVPPAFRFARS